LPTWAVHLLWNTNFLFSTCGKMKCSTI
jgi:hypothetical protein